MKIIKQGTRPAPKPPPWYMEPLTCPVCDTVFQLDSGDVLDDPGVHPEFAHGGFTVVTERSPNGKSKVTGSCPVCHERIMIQRKR